MVQIRRISIELAVFLMIALIAFGGFASLNLKESSEDSIGYGTQLTGDFSLSTKKLRSASCEESGGKWLVGRGMAKCICPLDKILKGLNCVANQQDRIVSPTITPCIPIKNIKMSACPKVCKPMWQLKNKVCTYNSCGSGCGVDCTSTFSTKAQCEEKINSAISQPAPTSPLSAPGQETKPAKKICRIDVTNCSPSLKINIRDNIISGTPDPKYDANSKDGRCVISPEHLINTLRSGSQYWEYNKSCGKILQRQ